MKQRMLKLWIVLPRRLDFDWVLQKFKKSKGKSFQKYRGTWTKSRKENGKHKEIESNTNNNVGNGCFLSNEICKSNKTISRGNAESTFFGDEVLIDFLSWILCFSFLLRLNELFKTWGLAGIVDCVGHTHRSSSVGACSCHGLLLECLLNWKGCRMASLTCVPVSWCGMGYFGFPVCVFLFPKTLVQHYYVACWTLPN